MWLEMNMKIHAGRLLQHRIKVNGVNVGVIDTDLTAARLDVYARAASLGYISMIRIGQPVDVARAVLYALRCYDTGAVIPCSGGVQLQTLNLRSMTALT